MKSTLNHSLNTLVLLLFASCVYVRVHGDLALPAESVA